MNWDLIGYIGTGFVLGSFLVNDITRLRIINTIGAVMWLIYGIALSLKPQILVNVSIILIHFYWFYNNMRKS